MQLDQFIKETIYQVLSGIRDAQSELKQNGILGAVSPVFDHANNLTTEQILQIEFDVAVTVESTSSSEKGGGAELGIQIVSADFGAKGSTSTTESAVSRIKFSVPYIPPSTVIDRGNRNTRDLQLPNPGIV